MNKLQWMSGLSLVTLLLASCMSNSNVSQAPTPKPSVEPVSVAPKPSIPSPAANVAPTGLILPTNPTTLPISRGRIDPFGAVAVSPVKQTVPNQMAQPNKNHSQKSQQIKSQPEKPQRIKSQPDKPQQIKSQSDKSQPLKSPSDKFQLNKPQSNKTQSDKSQPEKPQQNAIQPNKTISKPSTNLARAVEVNGVINLEGRLKAIVKEADEKISRSVSEGDYLSKGAVLVKRIQVDSNQEPLVILEQNGVEVIKPVSSTNGPLASIP
ncbi:MAG TPA: hypothetical protein V6D14_26830 [Coleofasciculaceae cyanobacterium]|jgi:hypothetical protein